MKNDYRIRNRYFCGILYEDDPNFSKYMNNIKKFYQEVTYIRHDKDVKENSATEEYKKPHYHILFKVGENARSLKSVAREIDIPENYLQGCNKKPMLMYLIHLNNPEKTQYDINNVQGELKGELAEILQKKEPEENKLTIIMQALYSNAIESINDLIIFGIDSGMLDIIRKYQFILTKAIEEKRNNRRLKQWEFMKPQEK